MADTPHVSQGEAAEHTATPDKRIVDLVDGLEETLARLDPNLSFAADPLRAAFGGLLDFNTNNPVQFGRVVYSVPYCNTYRVQLDRLSGDRWCCAAADGSLLPIGVRSSTVIPPNSRVMVWIPPGINWGIILGTVPAQMYDPNLAVPEWVQQGSGTGINRESCYTFPFKNLFREGGIMDFSNGRPLDGTSLDWGRFAETGIGIHIDPFQAFLRVNEACGLFLNYFDSYMRLAGVNLDIQSAVHELNVREDSGENRLFKGVAVYPWEALGLFKNGEEPWEEKDDKDVQFKKHYGKVDLKDGDEEQQSYYRYQEYGGYLGQGFRRLLISPADKSGKQLYSDTPDSAGPDFGVFEEGLGLDGSYWVRSAKGIYISKRCLIPVPKEIRLPEDQKEGDDKDKDNYKFSGTFGGGDEHKVGDIEIEAEEDEKHLLQAAGLFDVLAYHMNWKGLHPFHYHGEDYKTPEESAPVEGGPTATQENIDFSKLQDDMYLGYPEPKMVKIDERYGEVEYFEREAGIAVLPDGSLVLYDGYGSQITMTGGVIRLDTPGDVQLMPGRNILLMGGDDIVLRSKNSVDISAGDKDVRIKAERNMQLLAGNSGEGGMLLESKASRTVYDFDNKVGEDVVSSGITLKAAKSTVAAWAGDIYLRTGKEGDPLNTGEIVLDASKGDADVILKGQKVEEYVNVGHEIFIGPQDENSNVNNSFVFDLGGALIPVQLRVTGPIINTSGISTQGSVNSLGSFNSNSNPDVLPLGPAAAIVAAQISQARSSQEQANTTGTQEHTGLFTDGLYQDGQPGNDKTIEQASFSYRDDDEQAQYNTQNFKLAESRWQQMVRLNLGTGGVEWEEPKVEYQARQQLPWPGKKKWEDEDTLLQLGELSMYDTSNGYSKDRGDDGGPYLEPKLGELERIAPKTGFKVLG